MRYRNTALILAIGMTLFGCALDVAEPDSETAQETVASESDELTASFTTADDPCKTECWTMPNGGRDCETCCYDNGTLIGCYSN